ncbi:MAG: hypothetical protein IPM51_07000 [Sphingobacteriaceae bacterium]|nr:hypothetical protein [Sphingobacteriaceae bacterium]
MKIYQLIIIVMLMMPPLCSQTNKKEDFKNYIKEYIDGCDNSEEGMEWINFCIVDLKKYRKYFLKSYSLKNTTVFFQSHFLLDKNINLIEYTMGKDKQEFFVYITYDSVGKILDNIKIREAIKHSVRDKEVFFF